MTPQQLEHVNKLFESLRDLPPADRERTLDSRCPDDPAVRSHVLRLLAAQSAGPTRTTPASAHLSPRPGDSRVGQEFLGQRVGPYSIKSILGRGGMGVVFLAHDERLGRDVALKAVIPGSGPDELLFERLRREARALASLSHPNIATVYGLEEAHGTLFLAMEYMEGSSLAERISRTSLPVSEALARAEQIAAGLEAAHEEGIVHRDLKPANIMFAADGACKVLDFGLARSLFEHDPTGPTEHETLTQEGSLLGTPAYMSPEQARGEPLTPRSDIFSFGAVLFRCLAGRRAFDGESLREVIDAILNREPDWSRLPASVPPSVVSLLKRCLAKDLSERLRHIGDARLILRDARLERAPEPRPQLAPPRRPILPWAVAFIALLAAAGIAWRASHTPAVSTAKAQRFDISFPADTVQADLERLQLALSPDGHGLVAACKTPDGQALWARSHSDGRWSRIEQSEAGHRPVFSADGQWIAFFRNGHLYKHRPSGRGDPIELVSATNWYGACWADDGTLVYAPAWGVPLHKLLPGDTKPVALTRLQPGGSERAHLCPAPVSNSRWILYNAWTGGEQTDVHAVHLDTGEDHLVITNATCPRCAPAPRGDYLLFERASIIFAAPFDRAAAKVTGPDAAIAEGVMVDGTRFAAYFDVARDGSLTYVPGMSFAEESRLSYVNADGSATPFNDDRMSFCEPVFSAAASKLAVLVKGKVYRCLLYDLKRQTREFLVTGGDTLSLAASADGRSLACTVNRDDGYGIDLVSIEDGRRVGRIPAPAAVYPSDLAWTHDSKLIAFSMAPREGVPSDIWLVEPRDGAKPRSFVATTGADTKPVTSPSGDWLAYQSDVTGRAEIYLVSCPDGRATRQVSFGGGLQPGWSPDGKLLYFLAPEGLVSVTISPMGEVTGKPSVVYAKPFGQSDPIARTYAIAPDGRPLIVEPSERRPSVGHLNVIANWHRLLP